MLFTCCVKLRFLSIHKPTFLTNSENRIHWSSKRMPLIKTSLLSDGGYSSKSSVLSGFIFIKCAKLQRTIWCIQLGTSFFKTSNWNVSANERLPLESSANEDVLNLQCWNTLGCDLTLILKRGGPRTEPCGVPHGTSRLSENSSFILTRCVLPTRKDLNQSSAPPPIPSSSCRISSNLSGSIVSNAALRSRNIII